MINADEMLLLVLGAGVVLLAIGTETAWRRGWLPQWLARKLLHVGAIGSCALAPLWLQDLTVLRWIVALVIPVLFYLVYTRRLFSEANGRRSWGIALFPLAYGVLLLVFSTSRFLIVIPMAILAWSDAAAAISGQLFARKFFQLTGDRKSLPGSAVFFVTTVAIIWASQFIFPESWAIRFPLLHLPNDHADAWLWAEILFITLLLTTLEALGSNGLDNLLIPLGAAALLTIHYGPMDFYFLPLHTAGMWLATLIAFGFIHLTIRRRSLTPDGAVTAAFIGLWVLYYGGAFLLWGLVFFFVCSTLLGRLSRKRTVVSDIKHGKARDFRQVLCNGGVCAFLVTFHQVPNWSWPIFTAAAASLAISIADTWASEIGIYFHGRTYDIWRWQPTPVGLSGGVSWAGTLGGLAGALAISIFGFFLIFSFHDWVLLGIITISGFAGMLLDSLLGATLQARYREEETGLLTDIPTNILHSGFRWMSNDAINLFSNLVVALAVFGWMFFVHLERI